ncbi:MAG: L,D-transpeptidase family protein [Christensenellaceae bacterium]|jgi:uncharacterized protein YgiM (DUF1202 family)|nr:L,D-transpeptidase family protein [Christensenellaceae bacterium]
MKKRLLALILCLCIALMAFPSLAGAAVLPGLTSKIDYENTDPNLYTIEIDLVNQVLTVYQTATGAIVFQTLCTTGNEENPTGSGVFKLGAMKERFGYFVAYHQYAQYWTQVVRGIYIHSVMYDSKKLSSMSKSAYNNLGKNLSHGCVRILPHYAQWIFYNCPPGTTCNIVKNRPANPALKQQLKAQIPAYASYPQPADSHADPAEVPATVLYANVPVRTGFSASRDTTVATLGAGDHVMLLQLAQDWCKVRTGSGKLGYVKTAYLLCDPDNVQVTTGYKASAKTYVYAAMDTGSKKLATLPSGGQANVYENPKQGWWYGEYNGVTGYMRTKYVKQSTVYVFPQLTVLPGGAAGGGSDAQTPAATYGARVAPGIIANFRSLPSSDGAVLAELPEGTPVTIVSLNGSWYYCEVSGVYGYLFRDCVVGN